MPDAAHLKAPYTALHSVLEQIRAHNLGPALEWAQQHRAKLSHDGAPGGFEFRLHELNFINTLSSSSHGGGGQAAALKYAQEHFGPFKV